VVHLIREANCGQEWLSPHARLGPKMSTAISSYTPPPSAAINPR
jgi:hypothetical protein